MVNPEYVTKIVVLKEKESDNLLSFPFDHLQKDLDFHTRVRWEEDSVTVYDNRIVQNSVILDYQLGGNLRRCLIRVTRRTEKVSREFAGGFG